MTNSRLDILRGTRALQDQIIAWRRDFHMHPELGFREHRTAEIVARTMRSLGLRVETGIGKTGVVGYLGEGKPAIGIRADMDALPIQEENAVAYASCTPGVMHACGHDAHVAILLGVARFLAEMPDRPAGEIRFLFQPCEEGWDEDGKSGAVRMIEAGALDGLDFAIALHVMSTIPAGHVQICSGPALAAVDAFRASIFGKGCHGAYPHTGVDPLFILAQVLNVIQGIRSRRIDPIQTAVVSIGSVHAGDAPNVIPDEVKLRGTMRSYDDGVREQLKNELDAAFGVARAMGGDYQLSIEQGFPALLNDPTIAGVIRSVSQDVLGDEALHPAQPGMGSEDFAYMSRAIPAAMFMLGVQDDQQPRQHHSPHFDIDESALHIGAALLVESACRLLSSGV